MEKSNYLGIVALQLGLSQLRNAAGENYYVDPVDGKAGPATRAALYDLAKDLGLVMILDAPTIDLSTVYENQVMVFSLASDGEERVSEHFKVREFACHDLSDVVLIHPTLPLWAEEARKINGPFTPNSAYRTVPHNIAIGGASRSLHCRGLAMDIPAKNATAKELYDHFDTIMGDSGGLGIYDWGIHVDTRAEKVRWDERSK